MRALGGESRRCQAAPLPSELYIEVTNRCNSRCLTCPSTWGGQEPRKDLSFAELRALVEGRGALRRVVIHGIGEPLLNQELPAMVGELKRRGATVLFNSNAIALTPRLGRALVDAGLDELRVSLDGARPETYARVRGVDAFGQVLANIRALVRLQRALGVTHPRLSLWFTGLRDNVAELPDVVRLAARCGVPEVHLQRLVYRGAGLAVADQAIYSPRNEVAASAVASARVVAQQLGVTFSASGNGVGRAGPDRTTASAPWHGCERPWRLAYVTANGNVLPCCIAPFTGVPYESIVLGRAFEQPLAEVWFGERYSEFRERHASADDPPGCCRLCGAEWSL